MSLTCEISGEPLATSQEEVVATPSGHVCLKRLLLAKLSENGGLDPFETIRERPLSEDQLVSLNLQNSKIPAPRSSVGNIPNLLQNIQTEYDALVLELFDTRKALEDTRKELSQALYQNDAAVRVVARLSMERDQARQELERWNASAPNKSAAPAAAPEEEGEEPQPKRRRINNNGEPLENDLPEEDLDAMVSTWQQLQPQRKPSLAAAKAAAPSGDVLASIAKVESKSYHKTTCKSVTCMAAFENLVATAGKDKQLVVYDKDSKVVQHTFAIGTVATCVDIFGDLVAAGDAKGKVVVYNLQDGSSVGNYSATSNIVDVRIHPTTKHLCVATSEGKLVVCCIIKESGVQAVSHFTSDTEVKYSCGALHPDGLLYAAGTTTGQVHMWDLKNKVLASTLKVRAFVCACVVIIQFGFFVLISKRCVLSICIVCLCYLFVGIHRRERKKMLWSRSPFPIMGITWQPRMLRRLSNVGI